MQHRVLTIREWAGIEGYSLGHAYRLAWSNKIPGAMKDPLLGKNWVVDPRIAFPVTPKPTDEKQDS